MASVLVAIIIAIILVIILIAVGWLSLAFNIKFASGQENESAPVPAPIAPTVVNTPTPTAPNPNFQYLPQKAYVQAYGPEIGLPSSGALQPAPVVVAPAQQQTGIGGFDIGSMAGVLGVLGAGAAYLKGHFANKKADKNEGVIKENSASIVDSKIVQQEIARYMFNLDKAKADALNDAPAIKLEKLEQDKKEATETATKA